MQVNRLVKLPIKPSNVLIFDSPNHIRAVIGQIANLNAGFIELNETIEQLAKEYDETITSISKVTGELDDE